MAQRGGPDFLTVDDAGSFDYRPSAHAVLADFEYPSQAAAVLDRSGNCYQLRAMQGPLMLVRSPAKADLLWLHRAWREAQAQDPQRYPLQRVMPEADAAFLAGLFEVLELVDAGPDAEGGSWTLSVSGRKAQAQSFPVVRRLLSAKPDLSAVVVTDPFGHRYRAERHGRWPRAGDHGHFIVCRELAHP